MKRYKIIIIVVAIMTLIITMFYSMNNIKYIDNTEEIEVYFNYSVLDEYAYKGNIANGEVNLESQLISLVNRAENTIDIAAYELNLPMLMQSLMDKSAEGVEVRLIVDAKDPQNEYEENRYALMRIILEKLLRGKDGILGTDDDVYLLSNSPIFAVTDEEWREYFKLPPVDDLNYGVHKVGGEYVKGYMIAEGELKGDNEYYPPSAQMHNKFVIVDNEYVWTGSWNFTVTGLYGDVENLKNNNIEGNIQHCVEVYSKELAQVYTNEFEEMWGSDESEPNVQKSNFGTRKHDNSSSVYVGDTLVEVLFSPAGAVEQRMNDVVKEADSKFYLSTYCISDKDMVEILEDKYHNDDIEIKGIIDSGMWNMGWSANQKILREWDEVPPIFPDGNDSKHHAKTIIIDSGDEEKAKVVTGSTNFTNNGYNNNDENMLIIHDDRVSNLFIQEFYARMYEAVK